MYLLCISPQDILSPFILIVEETELSWFNNGVTIFVQLHKCPSSPVHIEPTLHHLHKQTSCGEAVENVFMFRFTLWS